MPRRGAGLDILTLTPIDDSCLTVAIDLPPAVAFLPAAGEDSDGDDDRGWDVADAKSYAQWEVRRLQKRLPPNVHSVSFGGAPSMCVGDDGEATVPPAEGPPWVVSATIGQPPSSPYHTPDGLRLRLLVGAAYPRSAPTVHFMQIVHHFFFDNDNGLPPVFYEVVDDLAADGRHSLRSMLDLLNYILQAPLHPCEGCQQQFDALAKMQKARTQCIALYAAQRRHPALFGGWRDEWLQPALRQALSATDEGEVLGALAGVLVEAAEGVYTFPMLTAEACEMLLDEVEAYNASGLPSSRPNSMNKYGLVLNEIGLEPLFDSLLARVLQPIAALLFPHEGRSLERHHSFVVQYEAGKDLGLDMHTDNSDVTFNVCLGRQFSGAGLTFCGYMGQADHRHFSYCHQHVPGHCVVHLGRRRHGADDIASGERHNLIVWTHNLAYRASRAYADLQQQRRYEREGGPPDVQCLSYTHDRDFLQYKERPAQHAKMTRRGWCPPAFARHDGPDDLSGQDDLAEVRRLQGALRSMREEDLEFFPGEGDDDDDDDDAIDVDDAALDDAVRRRRPAS